MKVTFSFKNIDQTPKLENKIHTKSEKLAKILGPQVEFKWSCYVKEGVHHTELAAWGRDGDYHAHAHSESMFKTLDLVTTKMTTQLKKQKEKLKNKIHRGKTELVILEPENAWTDYDEDQVEDIAS